VTDQALLTIRGLSVRLGDLELHDLDLELARGEIVAIRGTSGSGKTTLLRTLNLLHEPDAGRLELAGETAASLGWPIWRRRVCLVPQLPVMLTGSVRDEFRHAFGYRHNRDRDPQGRSRELLAALHLAGVADATDPTTLSVGQQQRLALVRALLLEPDVLLLDEPTSALDPASADAVREVVRQDVRDRSSAALVVTHESGDAIAWCDRTLDLAALASGARP
jgi:putative ABC transport system ATP-binding protein